MCHAHDWPVKKAIVANQDKRNRKRTSSNSMSLDVTKTGNGERGAGNGERKSGNELSAETSIKKSQYGR